MAQNSKNKIGLIMSTALVVGNMIGSGIFLLPSTLAVYGSVSILGWICSAIGAFLLASTFSYLSKILPKTGGPYAYAKAGFGEFIAFLVAWGYWISIWCGNAAITVAFIGYLSAFFPILATNNTVAIAIGLTAIWALSIINLLGVKKAAQLQLITTILKIIPIILITVVGIFYIDLNNFVPFNNSDQSISAAILTTATLTLWAFLGIESATIPADNIRDPQKTIPKATILGTIITCIINIMSCTIVMGIINSSQLMHSSAPFADAAAVIWNEPARYLIAAAAVLGTLGTLNGWILMQGQIPMATARDNLFPRFFAYQNKYQAPAIGIIISSFLCSVLMMMNFTKGLVETFKFIILLATMTALVPYLFSTASYAILAMEKKYLNENSNIGKLIIACLAFIYSLWAIAGSGQDSVYWGFILLMSGIPFYAWLKVKKDKF